MVVRRCHGIACRSMLGECLFVALHNFGVGLRRFLFQPFHQSFAETEADVVEVADVRVGLVRGFVDARIPVLVGRGFWLNADGVIQGIAAWRLAEMSVYT